MNVFLKVDSLGNGIGDNLSLFSSVGSITPNLITKSQLLAGINISVPDLSTEITISSSGECNKSITIPIVECTNSTGGNTNIDPTPTTTPTSTPTPTATQIAKKLPFSITTSWRIAKSDHGAPYFVALSGDYFSGPLNKAIYSSDGINWRESTISNSYQINDLTYFNGLFRILTNSNPSQYFLSSDGVGWTLNTFAAASRNGNYQNIARLPDGIELLNNYGSGDYPPRRISYLGGISNTYQHVTLPDVELNTQNIDFVQNFTVAGGRFIGCTAKHAYYSSNGSDWTKVSLPSVFGGYGNSPITRFANNKVVAFDPLSNKIAYSLDFGATWTEGITNLNSGLGGLSLVSLNNNFFTWRVRAGNGTEKIYQSSDGINWTAYDTPFINGSRIFPQALEYNPSNNKYILLGYIYNFDTGQAVQESYATYFEI
jgi:hypothetical protein